MTQLLAIFRAPLDQDSFDQDVFVELEFDESGIESAGKCFTTGNPDSSYRLMGFDHIVIAKRVEGGSQDIVRFQLKGPDDKPAVIHEMAGEELETCILYMWSQYQDGALDE